MKKTFYYKEHLGEPSFTEDQSLTLHREDGPAFICLDDDENIEEKWHQNGLEHREDGPSFLWHFKGGNKRGERWCLHGELHREDGPALIYYDDRKYHNINYELWCSYGSYRSGKEPYEIHYQEGEILSQCFFFEENIGSDLPSSVKYDGLNIISEKRWQIKKESSSFYSDGKLQLHRKNGPALISYDLWGNEKRIEWYQHGKWHRIDGPALTEHKRNYLYRECYYVEGLIHRENGPATSRVTFDKDKTCEWYVKGKLHREDGPAIITIDEYGSILQERWWLEGKELKDKG